MNMDTISAIEYIQIIDQELKDGLKELKRRIRDIELENGVE
jgi:hypothetical protein